MIQEVGPSKSQRVHWKFVGITQKSENNCKNIQAPDETYMKGEACASFRQHYFFFYHDEIVYYHQLIVIVTMFRPVIKINKFLEGYQIQQTPDDEVRVQRPKHCDYNFKDEDTNLNKSV